MSSKKAKAARKGAQAYSAEFDSAFLATMCTPWRRFLARHFPRLTKRLNARAVERYIAVKLQVERLEAKRRLHG